MARWYGSVINRIEENADRVDEIKVGTPMTEYFWSDRHAYEVVEVIDQKHVSVREYDVRNISPYPMGNDWEYISNPENPVRKMVKRGKLWFYDNSFTSADILERLEKADETEAFRIRFHLAQNELTVDDLKKRKVIHRYSRANVSFGVCDYYFDYEF